VHDKLKLHLCVRIPRCIQVWTAGTLAWHSLRPCQLPRVNAELPAVVCSALWTLSHSWRQTLQRCACSVLQQRYSVRAARRLSPTTLRLLEHFALPLCGTLSRSQPRHDVIIVLAAGHAACTRTPHTPKIHDVAAFTMLLNIDNTALAHAAGAGVMHSFVARMQPTSHFHPRPRNFLKSH
jgi:hypothetical protein